MPGTFELDDASVSFVGEAAADQSGSRVVGVGDVNGDQLDDLLISAPGSQAGTGKAYLIFGRTFGMTPYTNLANADASFIGEASGNQAGSGLAAVGDFNADGLADFAVGAHLNAQAGSMAGKVYLFFGKTSGWSRNVSLATADASFLGEVSSALTGWSIAGGGDVNADGYDDLVIGALGISSMAGKVYVVLGGPKQNFTKDMRLSTFPSFVGEAANNYAGASVAIAGDTNGDGYDDILVGAYGNSQAASKAGKTYLLLGHAGSWTVNSPLSQVTAYYLGQTSKDYAGYSVAGAGDIDDDGYADFIIGAPGRDATGDAAGMAAIIYGRSGSGSSYSLSQVDYVLNGFAAGDSTGSCVSGAGDVDGDGHADLLISAHYNDQVATDAGLASLLLGGPRRSGTETLSVSSTIFSGTLSLDQAGWSVSAAGDVDGDGFGDLLISAYGSDYHGAGSGTTYLILTGPMVDLDADGYSESMGDCNDYSAAQNPGMPEIPNNGLDDDCMYGDARIFRGRNRSEP